MQLLLAADDATRPLYVFTAFGAGVLSFLSPCVLPIVPAYLSLITGVSVGEMQEGDVKVLPRIAYDTALFVAGFTAVFGAILVGVVWLADTLVRNEVLLQRAGGVVQPRAWRTRCLPRVWSSGLRGPWSVGPWSAHLGRGDAGTPEVRPNGPDWTRGVRGARRAGPCLPGPGGAGRRADHALASLPTLARHPV